MCSNPMLKISFKGILRYLFFPQHLCYGSSFLPSLSVSWSDCWKRPFRTPPCHQKPVVVVIVVVIMLYLGPLCPWPLVPLAPCALWPLGPWYVIYMYIYQYIVYLTKQYTTLGPSFYFRNEMPITRRRKILLTFWMMIWKALDEISLLSMSNHL